MYVQVAARPAREAISRNSLRLRRRVRQDALGYSATEGGARIILRCRHGGRIGRRRRKRGRSTIIARAECHRQFHERRVVRAGSGVVRPIRIAFTGGELARHIRHHGPNRIARTGIECHHRQDT